MTTTTTRRAVTRPSVSSSTDRTRPVLTTPSRGGGTDPTRTTDGNTRPPVSVTSRVAACSAACGNANTVANGALCVVPAAFFQCTAVLTTCHKNCDPLYRVCCVPFGWLAAGKCNNVNNHCGCNWDGGDCCGPASDTSACDLLPDGTCCLDPGYRPQSTDTTSRATVATDTTRGTRTTTTTTAPTRGSTSGGTRSTATRADQSTGDRTTQSTTSRKVRTTTLARTTVTIDTSCAGACGNVGNKGNGACPCLGTAGGLGRCRRRC